jgi:hypothetical protein
MGHGIDITGPRRAALAAATTVGDLLEALRAAAAVGMIPEALFVDACSLASSNPPNQQLPSMLKVRRNDALAIIDSRYPDAAPAGRRRRSVPTGAEIAKLRRALAAADGGEEIWKALADAGRHGLIPTHYAAAVRPDSPLFLLHARKENALEHIDRVYGAGSVAHAILVSEGGMRGSEAATWWETPAPALGGRTPLETLDTGDIDKVLDHALETAAAAAASPAPAQTDWPRTAQRPLDVRVAAERWHGLSDRAQATRERLEAHIDEINAILAESSLSSEQIARWWETETPALAPVAEGGRPMMSPIGALGSPLLTEYARATVRDNPRFPEQQMNSPAVDRLLAVIRDGESGYQRILRLLAAVSVDDQVPEPILADVRHMSSFANDAAGRHLGFRQDRLIAQLGGRPETCRFIAMRLFEAEEIDRAARPARELGAIAHATMTTARDILDRYAQGEFADDSARLQWLREDIVRHGLGVDHTDVTPDRDASRVLADVVEQLYDLAQLPQPERAEADGEEDEAARSVASSLLSLITEVQRVIDVVAPGRFKLRLEDATVAPLPAAPAAPEPLDSARARRAAIDTYCAMAGEAYRPWLEGREVVNGRELPLNQYAEEAIERGVEVLAGALAGVDHSPTSELQGALLSVEAAARDVSELFGGSPEQWSLNGQPLTEVAADALLSLHDYLNDATLVRAGGTPAAPLRLAADGVGGIAAERQRQIVDEGFSRARDDAYIRGELADAAAAYLDAARSGRFDEPRSSWPWDGSWWKPVDRRTALTKAGALIAAELDRFDRAALRASAEAMTPEQHRELADSIEPVLNEMADDVARWTSAASPPEPGAGSREPEDPHAVEPEELT